MFPLPHAACAVVLLVAALTGCSVGPVAGPEAMRPAQAREAMARLLPAKTVDPAGWAADIQAAFSALDLPSTPENLCAALAVIEQESGFRVDPPVPGLSSIVWKEIERRAGDAGVPMLAVRAALALSSPDGRSYAERIDAARTERELSELFEDFIGIVPLGRTFLASRNPVRTGGPMQVSIAFAEAHARDRRYPYPVRGSLRNEVFTRRGGLYFGIAHLLDYQAPYDKPLYRFADFNAGRYASRNVAFQNALRIASGLPVTPDGDLLPHANPGSKGETERAADALSGRLDLSPAEVRRELEQGDDAGFQKTALYRRVFAEAERRQGRALPRAGMPRIDLRSPKITRKLTTEWFANRVDERHRRCMARIDGVRDD
jgi:hypothetical protein